jgi:DNA-binding SARP family transcriptional activator
MKDEIIHALWEAKDEIARGAKYNVRKLCHQLRKKQADSQLQIVARLGTHPATDTGKKR